MNGPVANKPGLMGDWRLAKAWLQREMRGGSLT